MLFIILFVVLVLIAAPGFFFFTVLFGTVAITSGFTTVLWIFAISIVATALIAALVYLNTTKSPQREVELEGSTYVDDELQAQVREQIKSGNFDFVECMNSLMRPSPQGYIQVIPPDGVQLYAAKISDSSRCGEALYYLLKGKAVFVTDCRSHTKITPRQFAEGEL